MSEIDRILIAIPAMTVGICSIYLALRTVRQVRGSTTSRVAHLTVAVAAGFLCLMGLSLIVTEVAVLVGRPPSDDLVQRSVVTVAWVIICGLILMVVAVPIAGFLEGRRSTPVRHDTPLTPPGERTE